MSIRDQVLLAQVSSHGSLTIQPPSGDARCSPQRRAATVGGRNRAFALIALNQFGHLWEMRLEIMRRTEGR